MAGMAEVEADRLIGRVTVLDYVAAVDCGIPITPESAALGEG